MHIRYKAVTRDRMSYWISGRSALEYKKGSIVRDHSGGLGIMTFKYRGEAVEFTQSDLGTKIIKVRPIGRAKKQPLILDISRGSRLNLRIVSKVLKTLKKVGLSPQGFLRGRDTRILEGTKVCLPWRGTLCYDAVEVLD